MDERNSFIVTYDITRNILARLPIKSLLRFKTVSKTFLTTISEPEFAGAHLCQSKSSGRQNLFIEMYPIVQGDFNLIKIENQECQVQSVLKYQIRKYAVLVVLCSCDGLFIFWGFTPFCCRSAGSKGRLFVLCNPSSKTLIPFCCPYNVHDSGLLFCGLCYDPLIEDYKFVATNMKHFHVVYHCRNNYWTEKKEFILLDGTSRVEHLRHHRVLNFQGFCLDGDLYWLLYDRTQHQYEIVCFDSREDTYRIVHKPEGLQNITNGIWHLTLLGEHLCLSQNMNDNSMMQIFKLQKDGDQHTWMEFITIDLSLAPTLSEHVGPLMLTNKNEIILQASDNRFVAYNPSENTFAEIQNKRKNLQYLSVPYLDNLFFSSRRNNGSENAYQNEEMVVRDLCWFE